MLRQIAYFFYCFFSQLFALWSVCVSLCQTHTHTHTLHCIASKASVASHLLIETAGKEDKQQRETAESEDFFAGIAGICNIVTLAFNIISSYYTYILYII